MLSFKSTLFTSALISSALLLSQVAAHGAISGLPTREALAFGDGKSNAAGNPIVSRPGSCTGMAHLPTQVKLPSGKDLKLPLMFRDGANHKGTCHIYLAKPDLKVDGGKSGYSDAKLIATAENCAQKLSNGPSPTKGVNVGSEMDYQIPAGTTGDYVLIWTLAATHISEYDPEYYDSCVDITIDDSASDPAVMPPKTEPFDASCEKNTPYGLPGYQGGSGSGSGQPDSTNSTGSGQPDSGKPDSGKPDSGKPDSGKPDSGKPDSGKPDSGKPDSGKPDSGKPDTGKPDSGKPDSGKPDSTGGQPDSGSGSGSGSTSGGSKKCHKKTRSSYQ